MPDIDKILKMFGGTTALSSHAPKTPVEPSEPDSPRMLLRPLPRQIGPRPALPPDAPDSPERRIIDFAQGLLGIKQEPGQTASGYGALLGAAIPVVGGLRALGGAKTALTAETALSAAESAAIKTAFRENAATAAVQEGITAYHGSPHNYSAERLIKWPDGRTEYIVGTPDVLPTVPKGAEVVKDFPLGRQRLDKIGTGEGAQYYGHGLYFSENPKVAAEYRDRLTDWGADATAVLYKGQPIPMESPEAHAAKIMNGSTDSIASLRSWAKGVAREAAPNTDLGLNDTAQKAGMTGSEYWNRVSDFMNKATKRDVQVKKGSTYQVKINASPDEFLDWDKRLADHSEDIQRRIEPLLPDLVTPTSRGHGVALTGGDIVSGYSQGGTPERVTRVLKDAGIPGIKYLDGASRSAGEGSRNYVVFDESLIDILKKYGVALPAIGVLQQLAKQNNGAVPESMIAPLLTKKKDHK